MVLSSVAMEAQFVKTWCRSFSVPPDFAFQAAHLIGDAVALTGCICRDSRFGFPACCTVYLVLLHTWRFKNFTVHGTSEFGRLRHDHTRFGGLPASTRGSRTSNLYIFPASQKLFQWLMTHCCYPQTVLNKLCIDMECSEVEMLGSHAKYSSPCTTVITRPKNHPFKVAASLYWLSLSDLIASMTSSRVGQTSSEILSASDPGFPDTSLHAPLYNS